MSRSISLVFCLHCQECTLAMISKDGQFSYVEAKAIRPRDSSQKILELYLGGKDFLELVEMEVDLPDAKRGLRYTQEGRVCGEALGDCCDACLAMFEANKGKMLVKHPLAAKKRFEEPKVVEIEKWRKTEGRKNGLPEEVTRRDLPDSNRQRGRQGKPPHIKNAGRAAGQARAGRRG